jgi:hypothetical protein
MSEPPKKETAAPTAHRNGGSKTDAEPTKVHAATLSNPARRTRLQPIWSEDKKHLQGWEKTE